MIETLFSLAHFLVDPYSMGRIFLGWLLLSCGLGAQEMHTFLFSLTDGHSYKNAPIAVFKLLQDIQEKIHSLPPTDDFGIVLTLNGDMITQSPYVATEQGEELVRLLIGMVDHLHTKYPNKLALNYTLGNHEGDYSSAAWEKNMKSLVKGIREIDPQWFGNFKITSANLNLRPSHHHLSDLVGSENSYIFTSSKGLAPQKVRIVGGVYPDFQAKAGHLNEIYTEKSSPLENSLRSLIQEEVRRADKPDLLVFSLHESHNALLKYAPDFLQAPTDLPVVVIAGHDHDLASSLLGNRIPLIEAGHSFRSAVQMSFSRGQFSSLPQAMTTISHDLALFSKNADEDPEFPVFIKKFMQEVQQTMKHQKLDQSYGVLIKPSFLGKRSIHPQTNEPTGSKFRRSPLTMAMMDAQVQAAQENIPQLKNSPLVVSLMNDSALRTDEHSLPPTSYVYENGQLVKVTEFTEEMVQNMTLKNTPLFVAEVSPAELQKLLQEIKLMRVGLYEGFGAQTSSNLYEHAFGHWSLRMPNHQFIRLSQLPTDKITVVFGQYLSQGEKGITSGKEEILPTLHRILVTHRETYSQNSPTLMAQDVQRKYFPQIYNSLFQYFDENGTLLDNAPEYLRRIFTAPTTRPYKNPATLCLLQSLLQP